MIKTVAWCLLVAMICFAYAFLVDVAFVLILDRFSTSGEFLVAYSPLLILVIVTNKPPELDDELEEAE